MELPANRCPALRGLTWALVPDTARRSHWRTKILARRRKSRSGNGLSAA